jgi:putative DNA primase/helicase
MSQNHVIELANTPKQRPIVCDYAGGRFRLTADGLTFIGIDKDGTPLPPRWICASLYVVAKTRDAQSGEWGRLLEWQDDDGVTQQRRLYSKIPMLLSRLYPLRAVLKNGATQ